MIELLLILLLEEEGYREDCYLCSEGYVTVGIGTRVHSEPTDTVDGYCIKVSREAALALARRDAERAQEIILNSKHRETFLQLDTARQVVLVSMAYQMGYGVLRFEKMWAALAEGDWEEAQIEALDSRWAKQTRARALRHSEVLLTGVPTRY